MAARNILILGVGNTLLSDEGFGVRAVEYLQANYQWPENINLVDGGTRGLMLMSELMECELAIVLDIALGGHKPGTFYLLDDECLDKSLSFRESMHQTSLNDILISCDLAGSRPQAMIFAMEPFDFQTVSESLSPKAQEALPRFCARVVEEMLKRDLL